MVAYSVRAAYVRALFLNDFPMNGDQAPHNRIEVIATMKRLLLSTVLAFGALGAVAPVHASQYVSPWFEGQWFCDIEGSRDRLGVRYTIRDVPNTSCRGDRCSTSGYRFIPQASVRLSSWNQAHAGQFVVDHGSYITFYFLGDNKHFVRLDKPRRTGRHRRPAFGVLAQGGRNWRLSCRKAS
jgi:hypothetical protein